MLVYYWGGWQHQTLAAQLPAQDNMFHKKEAGNLPLRPTGVLNRGHVPCSQFVMGGRVENRA